MAQPNRGMFRVYHCRNCNYTGFAQVESESEETNCSLCQQTVTDADTLDYTATTNEARDRVTQHVLTAEMEQTHSTPSRGLGVKRRVLNIIDALVDTKRGRPVSEKEVLEECTLAKIPQERARHFIGKLEDEGLVIKTPQGFVLDRGGI